MSSDAGLPQGRGRPVTIRDIAREAGVSIATVSRVFNDPRKVSRDKRDLVLAAIERNHYVSDGLAGGLARRRSRLIGIVIPTITNSIYASSTQAMQQVAQDAGYTALVGVSEFSLTLEADIIHRLLERRVEGLILTGATRDEAVYRKIVRNHCPFVITWQLTRDESRPSVSFDNFAAARSATEYLIGLGHRRLALICGRTDLNDRALVRRRAFEDAVARHGLPSAAIIETDFDFVEGQAAMRRLLGAEAPPSAVFCANDIQAIGAISACHESGLAVPGDVSIVGFDDLPIARYVTPRLTTVRVPAAEMGKNAAQRLISAIENGEMVHPLELDTDLIIRSSAGPPTLRKTVA